MSILAANLGYTLFLLPALAAIFPKSVSLGIANIIAFMIIDSLAGMLLGIILYMIIQKTKVRLPSASAISVSVLWFLYWIPSVQGSKDIRIMSLDGAAALITWLSLMTLAKRTLKQNEPFKQQETDPV